MSSANPFFASRSMSIYPSMNFHSSCQNLSDSFSDNSPSEQYSILKPKMNDKNNLNDCIITNESIFATMETMKDTSSIDEKKNILKKTNTVSFSDLAFSHPHKKNSCDKNSNGLLLDSKKETKNSPISKIENKKAKNSIIPLVIEENNNNDGDFICGGRSTEHKEKNAQFYCHTEGDNRKELRKTAKTSMIIPIEENEDEDIFGRTPKNYKSKRVNKVVNTNKDNEAYIDNNKDNEKSEDDCNCNNCFIF